MEDLLEYDNGTEGCGKLLIDLLREINFKGDLSRFYDNIICTLLHAVEDRGENIVTLDGIDLPFGGLKLRATIEHEGRLVLIPECVIIDRTGEEYNISKDIEDYYVHERVSNPNRQFRDDFETSMLEIVKKIKKR